MKYVIVIFFILCANIFAQPNVAPNPNQVGLTYEQIITMYPTYYLGNKWYGAIYYQNTLLPGTLYYYFGKNRCYAIKYVFATEDSAEALSVYNQYLSYVTQRYGINGHLSINWGDNPPVSLHRFWTGRPLGWGAVMLDASRIQYTHIQWDGRYYLVWMSMFRNQNATAPGGVPNTKPKIRLQ